ncbi:hypothetical protein DNU06_01950 [Putridiphycobacter roseus]|uniref:Uncharacterized protein n=1 Tax=Putridiphycobacter roseus TaxID=2219161 RepID=A0A2W1NV17_9FLAO|nr:hypothetical protein [Putridiphycobacter roseus]PZE18618.1 hypothetical protein DNU06_01950 [Putridiphycobacter roseus]
MKALIIFSFLIYSPCIFSQNDSIGLPKLQFSVIYPIGSNGIQSKSKTNNFSFNLFYGLNGGLNGLEIGGLANANTGDVNGLQIGGLSNINTKAANGIIIAGLTNIAGDSSHAISIAGIANKQGGSFDGMQLAGITNYIQADMVGIQVAGISNTVIGNTTGIQVAGINNYSNGSFYGCQIAGISNVNKGDLTGIQVGLINHAKEMTGMQVGLFNIASSYKSGVPIGLFSFVKDGFHAIDFSYNESINANLSLKLGVPAFYNIFKVGYMPFADQAYYTYGIGAGTMLNLTKKFKISAEASASHIVPKVYVPKIDFLVNTDLNLRFHLTKHIGFFAGPSLNIYFTETDGENSATTLKIPYKMYTDKWWYGQGETNYWIGYNAGISILF